jgi:hypothetical protein
VLDCSKNAYPSQWAAERALHAIQASRRSHGRKAPTGSSYWCDLCKAWHLTSKSKSQTPSWSREKRSGRMGIGSRADETQC